MPETIHLLHLLATFAGWVGRRQTAVIAYLVEDNPAGLVQQLYEEAFPGGREPQFL